MLFCIKRMKSQNVDKSFLLQNGPLGEFNVTLDKDTVAYTSDSCSPILKTGYLFEVFHHECFAHGFYCYDNLNIMHYKLSDYYKPGSEGGIMWNDKSLKIKWPTKKPILSKKDSCNLNFQEFLTKYKSL